MTELSCAKAARTIRQAKLDWSPVSDPRKKRGKRYSHLAFLNLFMVAFASGQRTLRQFETVTEDMSPKARRRMGMKKEISDTAMDDLLRRQTAEGMDNVLERQVKDGLKSKAIRNDLFDEGVIAIDGKAIWVGNFAAHPKCQLHENSTNKSPYWMLFAQRAVLVSSSAAPCLGQHFIENKEAETSEFAGFFGDLLKRYGKSFEIVTSDAGACSRKNAKVVNNANRGYLFALKANQPHLFEIAKTRLSSKEAPFDREEEPELTTSERYRGATVTRDLFRHKIIPGDPSIDFAGARQLWRVRQTTVRENDNGKLIKRTVEDRYFITNRVMGTDKALRLVRLHWGIENGANWTLDVAMNEDTSSPCQRGEALVTISWLRLLAYNLVSLFRSKQPIRHGDKMTWARAFELLKLIFLTNGEIEQQAFVELV